MGPKALPNALGSGHALFSVVSAVLEENGSIPPIPWLPCFLFSLPPFCFLSHDLEIMGK